MPNLNVAVLGSPEYAKGLGKKSTTSDITFYDMKRGDVTLSLVEPSKYPEKLASLFFTVSLADMAIVVVERIDPSFGESIVMLDCAGVKNGYVITRGYITREQIAPFIKGTVVESYSQMDDDPVKLREELLNLATEGPTDHDEDSTEVGSVAVDHYFDVKGVGTVVLGCVSEGVIRRHDSVKVRPNGMDAEIRSIQKHDDDFDTAEKGDRVGLALRGVTVSELDRGTVLSNHEGLVDCDEITVKAHLVKYWLNPLKEGMVLHIGHWMQFEPARIVSIGSDSDWRNPELRLKLQKSLVYHPKSRAVMTYLEGGKLRVVGTVELV